MERIILALDTSAEQKQGLDALIAAQQDPASPQYQKWLTPEAFADQFGVSQNDVDQVTAWLGTHGFQVDEVPAGRRTIVFSGTAQMVRAAFHTQIRMYNVNGALHYANASDPEIPEALSAVVRGTVTLHDFARKSMKTQVQAVPDFTSGGTYYLAPADFATIYNLNGLYNLGNDGTGQTIAIVGRTNINVADVTAFRGYFGLPVNNPQVIVNGTNPGITSDLSEALLDVEWSGAVARGATIKLVVSASTNSTDGVDLSAQYIVSNNLAHVMSTSYGSCEAAMGTGELAFYNNLWQQAAAQGISSMISSDDSGAAGCDAPLVASAGGGRAVNGLCSSVHAVCVGGTEFNDSSNYSTYWLSSMSTTTKESAISYIPELAWNQSGSVGGSGLWATGGGASAYYAKPSWQTGPGVPADGQRDVPDVSLAASTHDGFLIVQNGGLYAIGGTSAASPSFAGIMAMVDQKTGSAQGNPNPKLYALAAFQAKGTSEHAYFHDVTSGSNTVPGLTGFSAGTGYDLATGLGSVNGVSLVEYWGDAVVTVPATMSVSMSAGAVAIAQGGSGTSTANILVTGAYSNAVTLAVSGMPAGVTATLASRSFFAPGSGSSVLTIAVSAATPSQLATITVTATGGGVTSAANVSLAIVPPFRLTKNIDAVTVPQGSSAPMTLTSTSAGGFSGAVALTASLSNGSALPAGVTVGFAPSTISSPGSGTSTVTVAASNSAVAGRYSIAIKGTSGSLTNTIILPLMLTSSATFTLAAAPSSVTMAAGASSATTITMTAASGFTSSIALSTGSLPAGITVQFSSTSITQFSGTTFTARAASTVAAGSYPITVTGTGGGVTPAPTVVVTIVVSGFTITPGSAAASLAHGGSVVVALGTAVTNGFSGALNLTVTGLPTGVTAVFTPQTITNPAAGNSSLRLTGLEHR